MIEIKGEISQGVPGYVANFTPIPEFGKGNSVEPRFREEWIGNVGTSFFWWEGVGIIKRAERDKRVFGFRTALFYSSYPYNWRVGGDYNFREALINWSLREDIKVLPKYTHPPIRLIEGAYPRAANLVLEKIWQEVKDSNGSVPVIIVPTLNITELLEFGLLAEPKTE